jgi:GGDEF domain-containing protein
MNLTEHTVWALMSGGLLSLVLLTAIDAVVTGSVASLRSFALISAASATFVILSGLPEALWPQAPARLWLVLKAGLGLLGVGLGLRLLAVWSGAQRDDRFIRVATLGGGTAAAVAGLLMMVLAAFVPLTHADALLTTAALLNALPVLTCVLVAVRVMAQGDPLGRWLLLACLVLLFVALGLYLRVLQAPGLPLWFWTLVAACALLYVLVVMMLILERNRVNRELARLARLDTGRDPATGLPTGARLLTEVDHVFWRTGRMHGKCVVLGLYVANLYALSDPMGHSIDNQILAARIRRAAGFRCVVGLYHPRCFIVVFTGERRQPVDPQALRQRFLPLLTQSLHVMGSDQRRRAFAPQVGMAVLTVRPDEVQPQDVIDEAEHAALLEARALGGEDQAETRWPASPPPPAG